MDGGAAGPARPAADITDEVLAVKKDVAASSHSVLLMLTGLCSYPSGWVYTWTEDDCACQAVGLKVWSPEKLVQWKYERLDPKVRPRCHGL